MGLEERISFGIEVVGGQIGYFSKMFGLVASEWKHDGSRVTEADLTLSTSIMEEIKEAFPSDQFFSEELEPESCPITVKPGYSWMLDPIDGTNNFANGISLCGISLALLKDGDPVYGFVYDHASRKLYHGGENKGMFAGDTPIKIDRESVSSQSIISVQTAASEESVSDVSKLQMKFKVRSFGSSALHLTYVTVGLADGVVEHSIKTWDIAAGYAILKASGGEFRFFGEPQFPLREFHVQSKGFGFMAGSPSVCRELARTTGRA
ncbi:inositol monophosphatase [Puniceicoccaceae bacterium K14]|nr:inositol monophosphatase [Puniceicoccaceae bacterium K14]